MRLISDVNLRIDVLYYYAFNNNWVGWGVVRFSGHQPGARHMLMDYNSHHPHSLAMLAGSVVHEHLGSPRLVTSATE